MLAKQYDSERDHWEFENIGNFKMIYPLGCDADPYKKFMKFSKATWEEFNFGPKPQIEKR